MEMMVHNNSSTDHQPVDTAYIAIEILVAILAAIGNILVIIVFIRYRSVRSITNYYVMSLATADLLVALLGIPFAIATSVGLPQNFEACILMNSLLLLLCTGSIFSLVAVALDRFYAIKWPLRYATNMTSSTCVFVIALSWILAAVVGLVPSLGWNAGPPSEPRCFFMEVMDKRYLATVYFSTIVLPIVTMACIYWLIYQAVTHQVKQISKAMIPKSKVHMQQKLLRSQTQAAKTLAVIIILFCISWVPLYTFNAVACFCNWCATKTPTSVIKFFIVLSHCNSVWNPALYAWGMRDFKQGLCRLCCNKKYTTYFVVYETKVTRTGLSKSEITLQAV